MIGKKLRRAAAIVLSTVMAATAAHLSAVTAMAADTYTLSCTAKDSNGAALTDIDAGETFTLDVALSGDGSTVGSAQFAVDGDWYTVVAVNVPKGMYRVSDDMKKVAITGLDIATGTDTTTIAALTLKANTNITDGAGEGIGFVSGKSYITATNSTGEVIPATVGCGVTLRNVTVTLKAGNAVFDGVGTKKSVTAYAKYNTAGLYSDEARTISLTLPEVTASTGYRTAAGTDTDPLWKDMDNKSYKDNNTVETTAFTEAVMLTAQTTKQYTVTIKDVEDTTKGNIGDYTGSKAWDTGTTLQTIVKGISLQDTPDGTYYIIGWTAVDTNGTVTVNDTTSYKLHSDITITPIVGALKHEILYVAAQNAAVSGVKTGDAVYYGTDVTFTVRPDSGYRVYSVQYDNGTQPKSLPYSASGSYTIPGTDIVDDIVIYVNAKQYSTVGAQAGTGSTMTAKAYYAWADSAGLYTSLDGLGDAAYAVDETTLKGDLAAESGYRLADDTAAEPLWSDGTTGYTTAAILAETKFSADTVLTANVIKTHNVTFTAGQNGSLSGETAYTIDDGKTLTALPTAAAADYYVFDRWAAGGKEYTDDELKALPITDDTAVTAEFTPASYNVTFAASELADFTDIGGVTETNGAYSGTYKTDITFKLNEKSVEGHRIEYVYYTVGTDGTEITLTPDGDGVYTIDGESIKGNIAVSIEAEGVRTITFVTNDETKGTVGGTTSFIVADGEMLSETSFDEVVYSPLPGYAFTESWANGDTAVTKEEILAESGTENVTYSAVFDYADYLMTDTNSIVSVESGVVKEDDNGKHVQYDTDIVFTITAPVTEIGYTADGGEKIPLTADSEGKYTIDGTAVVGNIEVYSTVVTKSDGTNASFTFITKEEYIGEAITAFDDGRKIVVLDADKLQGGSYKLSDGRDFFCSTPLGGYVAFVDTAETAVTLSSKLSVDANAPVREISYDGDLNGSGDVTAADAGMLEDILGNKWTQVVTDEQLLMLDTKNTDGRYVYTSDVNDILKKAADAAN